MTLKAPKPGDLIVSKVSSVTEGVWQPFPEPLKNRLFAVSPSAIRQSVEDVYHHRIVAIDDWIRVDSNEVLLVLHFFNDPQFVQYAKNTDPSESFADLKGYIAYVLFDEKYWATDVFDSLEDFFSVYKVVST